MGFWACASAAMKIAAAAPSNALPRLDQCILSSLMSRMSEVFRIAENIFVLRKRLSGAGAPVNATSASKTRPGGLACLAPAPALRQRCISLRAGPFTDGRRVAKPHPREAKRQVGIRVLQERWFSWGGISRRDHQNFGCWPDRGDPSLP